MTTVFPGAVDSLPRPTPSTKRNAGAGLNLSTVVDNLSDAVEAIETKLGTTPAATDTLDYVYIGNGAGKGLWLPASYIGQNLLVNGDFSQDQTVGPYTTTNSRNNDDVYTLDGWTLLSDGNNIVDVAQDTTAANIPAGARAALKATVVTANKKFGFVNFVENRDARKIIGGTASVVFQARTKSGGAIDNMMAAVLAKAGTADTLTSDVVSAWGATNVEPTWEGTWTREGAAPTRLALTTGWQTFTIPNVAVDTASATNVALVLWSDDTTTTIGDELWIADVHLVEGANPRRTAPLPIALAQLRARRYYENNYQIGISPLTTAQAQPLVVLTTSIPNGAIYSQGSFTVDKLKTPVVTIRPYTTPANTSRSSDQSGADYGASSAVPVARSKTFHVTNASGGALTVGSNVVHFGWEADARL